MYILKQFLKELILPPVSWMVLLIAVLVFWKQRWARRFMLIVTVILISLHSGWLGNGLAFVLESRYSPLIAPSGEYDCIVVLSGGAIPAGGRVPFPTLTEQTFRRLEEAKRLYDLRPRPIIVSGGHADPFTASEGENAILCDYLMKWGVAPSDIIAEAESRDTFESAIEVHRILLNHGWKQYLLVTSALHMPRSMLAFSSVAPTPIPAPGDFTIHRRAFSIRQLVPTESAGGGIERAVHEYLGLINYWWRAKSSRPG